MFDLLELFFQSKNFVASEETQKSVEKYLQDYKFNDETKSLLHDIFLSHLGGDTSRSIDDYSDLIKTYINKLIKKKILIINILILS